MPERKPRFSLINLGCPKNTVDSEGILGCLSLAGFQWVEPPAAADICIVNTCGFLDPARQEAAQVLAEVAGRRNRRGRPLLVAAGCLAERAGSHPELARFLKEADARVGFADYVRLPEICRQLLQGKLTARACEGWAGRTLPKSYLNWLSRPRMRIGLAASAYLKLAEGCSNCCAYCAIPLIRGRRISRPPAAVLKEAEQLVASGARELNLIAQDSTAYGLDTAGRPLLASLLRDLCRRLAGPLWFRVLYSHPKHLTQEILEAMAADPRICPYVDMPVQHVNDQMLKRMGRGYGHKQIEALLEQIDRILPGAARRTSLIVGHPGEGEREFAELLKFVEEGQFDHLGVFCWSPEPGTVSARMEGGVPPAVAEERRARILKAQAEVSARRLRAHKGERTTLLLEGREKGGWRGRTPWQAPEVDGITFLESESHTLQPGEFATVRIVRTGRYDCHARLLSS